MDQRDPVCQAWMNVPVIDHAGKIEHDLEAQRFEHLV